MIKGVGSPHTKKGNVWPIGIIMQALTSCDAEEIKECIDMLLASHAGTDYMHESINADDRRIIPEAGSPGKQPVCRIIDPGKGTGDI